MQQVHVVTCLYVAVSIGNHIDIHLFGHDPIDDTVGFEKNLSVLAKRMMDQHLNQQLSIMPLSFGTGW